MASIWTTLLRGEKSPPDTQESLPAVQEQRLTFDEWAEQYMTWQGNSYLLGSSSFSSNTEDIGHNFPAYIQQAYKANGPVFACQLARMLVFTDMRFSYQRISTDGTPGDLFTDLALRLLEHPWPNGTTGELLARALQDTDFAGNHYVLRENDRLRRLRPDWVQILLTAPPDEAVRSDVEGYVYKPGGTRNTDLWEYFPVERISHWSPIPDPESQYRGMSWLTPIIREIQADKSALRHKQKFFDNGATAGLVVAFKDTTEQQFEKFMRKMDETHKGVDNAFKTLYLGGGADVTVIGQDLKNLDFTGLQGKAETRIAAAARIHPAIVGLSEGLQGSSLNAGNYAAARENFGDGTLRPLWRSLCAAYEPLVPRRQRARLWYDDRDVPFLRQDRKKIAEIEAAEARTITSLVQAGFTPESVIEAVRVHDWRRLKHTHLFSVQLQPAGTGNNGGNNGAGGVGDEPDDEPDDE